MKRILESALAPSKRRCGLPEGSTIKQTTLWPLWWRFPTAGSPYISLPLIALFQDPYTSNNEKCVSVWVGMQNAKHRKEREESKIIRSWVPCIPFTQLPQYWTVSNSSYLWEQLTFWLLTQLFPLRVLLCSVSDPFERSALRKQLNLELIFSDLGHLGPESAWFWVPDWSLHFSGQFHQGYRNWVPGRWHWEPAWVPINIMLLFYSHHSEIRSTSTRMVSIWKTSRSWYRCKETINSQVHCCHA